MKAIKVFLSAFLISILLLLTISAKQLEKSNSKKNEAIRPLDQTSSEMKGDCNGDGKINLQDALLAELMAIGKMEASLFADLNGDSNVTREDVKLILQIIGEELLFSSFDKKEEKDIEESWEYYNAAFGSYIKELQAEAQNAKTKESMMRYLKAYFNYIHSIRYKSNQDQKTSKEKTN